MKTYHIFKCFHSKHCFRLWRGRSPIFHITQIQNTFANEIKFVRILFKFSEAIHATLKITLIVLNLEISIE